MAISQFPIPVASTTPVGTTPVATGFTYSRFNASGTFTLPSGYNAGNPLNVDIIAVGGGGAGGNFNYGGGGGAGDVAIGSFALTAGCTITIGAGGTTVTGTTSAGVGGTGGTTQVISAAGTNFNYAANGAAKYGNGSDTATGFSFSGSTYQRAYWNTAGTQVGSNNGVSTGITNNSPIVGIPKNAHQHVQWNNTTKNYVYYTQSGLVPNQVYAVSFWYGFNTGSGNGETFSSPFVVIQGTETAVSVSGATWNQYTGSVAANGSGVIVIGIAATAGGANPFFLGYELGYIRITETTATNPYSFGGYPEDGSGGFAYAGTAGASTIQSFATIIRAFGGGGGGIGNTSNTGVVTGIAPASGGSAGGNGSNFINADNIQTGIASVAGTPTVFRNGGGASARTQFPMGGTVAVDHFTSSGGGGAMSAGGDSDWFNGIGGRGGTGYDANPWVGSSTTLATNILGSGGAGHGRKGIGAASLSAGLPQVNAPYNTSTVMRNAISPTANTGSGGAGAGGAVNTATNGAAGVVIIRYKA
jgi:hypothetical protein